MPSKQYLLTRKNSAFFHWTPMLLLLFLALLMPSFVAPKPKGWFHKKFVLKSADGQQEQLLMDATVRYLDQQDDSEVYRTRPIQWPSPSPHSINFPTEMPLKSNHDDVVIKVVKFLGGGVRYEGQGNKPWKSITREVDMFELARRHQSKLVLNLFESHLTNGAVYMVLELGQSDLGQAFRQMKKNWEAPNVPREQTIGQINLMVKDMARALADMHRFAVHFSIKPENWLYVNGVLKLIDLQTTYATNSDGVVLNEPSEYFDDICEAVVGGKTFRAIAIMFQSPEFRKMCNGFLLDGTQIKSVPRLTTMVDIWHFGRLIAALLATNPLIRNRKDWKWPEGLSRAELPWADWKYVEVPMEMVLIALSFPEHHGHGAIKEMTAEIFGTFKKEFPLLTPLMQACFRQNPAERPSAGEIAQYLEEIPKMKAENSTYEEAMQKMSSLIRYKPHFEIEKLMVPIPGEMKDLAMSDGEEEILPEAKLEIQDEEFSCNGVPLSKMEKFKYNSISTPGKIAEVEILKTPEIKGKGGFSTVFVGYMHTKPVQGGGEYSVENCVAVKTTKLPKMASNCFATVKALKQKLSEEERKHIVEIIDYGNTPQDKMYITVMELADGSLEKWVEDIGLESKEAIGQQIAQLAVPLVEMHKVALHLDLKRPNFVYAKDANGYGTVKLIDFDLSVRLDQGQMHAVVGNEWGFLPTGHTRIDIHAAPEYSDYRQAKVNTKTDMWAVGMMVMEMFMHRHRIGQDKLVEILEKMATIFRGFEYRAAGETLYRYNNLPIQKPVHTKHDAEWLLANLDELYFILEALERFPKALLLAANLLQPQQPARLSAQGVLEYLGGKCKLPQNASSANQLILFGGKNDGTESLTLGKLMALVHEELEGKENKGEMGRKGAIRKSHRIGVAKTETMKRTAVKAKTQAMGNVGQKIVQNHRIGKRDAKLTEMMDAEENADGQLGEVEDSVEVNKQKLAELAAMLARIEAINGPLDGELGRQSNLNEICNH